MADVNYMNASSLNPGTGYKPTGFLGGMVYGDDMAKFQQQYDLQHLMQQMEAQKQAGQLQDYEAARPSALKATIAGNNATADTVGDLKRGEADSSRAAGDLAMKTLESHIKAQVSSNDATTRKNALAQVQHGMQVIDSIGPMIESGDKLGAIAAAREAGLNGDNPMLQHVLNSSDPKGTLKQWRDTLGRAMARKEIAVEEVKQPGRMELQEIKNATAIAVAELKGELRANAQRFSLDEAAVKGKTELKIQEFATQNGRMPDAAEQKMLAAEAAVEMFRDKAGVEGGKKEPPKKAGERAEAEAAGKLRGVLREIQALRRTNPKAADDKEQALVKRALGQNYKPDRRYAIDEQGDVHDLGPK